MSRVGGYRDPDFTTQLEKSREATDLANVRAAYAEQMSELLESDGVTAIADINVPVNKNRMVGNVMEMRMKPISLKVHRPVV